MCCVLGESRHTYTFDHQILTDGISISILLKKKDVEGGRVRTRKPASKITEKYVDDLEAAEYTDLRTKKIVAIDPNMSDLLFCVNSDQRYETV